MAKKKTKAPVEGKGAGKKGAPAPPAQTVPLKKGATPTISTGKK
jgi:hypothetical protein